MSQTEFDSNSTEEDLNQEFHVSEVSLEEMLEATSGKNRPELTPEQVKFMESITDKDWNDGLNIALKELGIDNPIKSRAHLENERRRKANKKARTRRKQKLNKKYKK